MRRTFPRGIKQLAANYASGSLSPVTMVDTALQIATESEYLNAFTKLTPEVAITQANESSYRYKKHCQKSVLDGIPITIKDNFCTKDIETTCSSKMLKGFIPTYNATVVERLIEAGAVILGKTNMDEFAMGSGTTESSFGPSKNIWSKSYEGDDWNITGGSSGGSATSVAAGICFASIGSDTGGSVRQPAAYNGIVGLKPTYGLVSRHGLIPLANSMDCPGVLTRTVDDCAVVLNAISGPDPKDSTSIKESVPNVQLPFLDELNVHCVRVGIPKEYHCEGMCPEVLESWRKIADMLEEDGAQVSQVSLENTIDGIYVYSVLNQCEVASNMARYDGVQFGHRADSAKSTEEMYSKSRSEGFGSVVKTRILAGNYFLLKKNYDEYFVKAMKARRLISDDFQKAFKQVDVLLTPTTLTAAPPYKEFTKDSNRDQCAINDVFTTPVNLAGLPAVSIPIRLSTNGLPIGLQLIGNMLSENLLLRVAKWIESRVDFQESIAACCLRLEEMNVSGLVDKPK